MVRRESIIMPLLNKENLVSEPSLRSKPGFVLPPFNPPIAMLGVPFDNVSVADTVTAIEKMVASRRPHYLVTANVDFLVQAQSDVELHRILLDAHLVVCDGTPLLWASRLLGNPLPERVAGADLVPLLIQVAERRKYRLFFLGATPESAQAAVNNLQRHYKEIIIAGHYSPPFGKLLEMDHDEIKRRIADANPDLLFVSFGCPKQEKWIAMHYRSLGVPVAAGVGATIDFLAGHVRRAPQWMQRTGTEWIFRLAQEPRRLFGRYSKDLWVFGHCILGQWWRLQWRARRPLHNEAQWEARLHCISDNENAFQICTLPPRFDLEAARNGALPIEKILKDGRPCLLQMDQVEFIDSTGIGMLIQLQKQLRLNGDKLILLCPSDIVESSLELLRLDRFFAKATGLAAAKQLLETHALEASAAVASNKGAPAPVLRWQGEITAVNASKVWADCQCHLKDAAEASQPEVIIDLSAVRFIDSSGLGVMVQIKKLAQRHGTKLVFTTPQPEVLNVLHLSRLEEFLLGRVQKGQRKETVRGNRQ
jgi:N-acetylglucosaminyldiphosphoundecaprenol N-acetyl-beta-D-mannosaminyltransferase